jgi:hypothetical protein
MSIDQGVGAVGLDPDAVIDVGLTQPLGQRHRVHPEICGDRLDGHPAPGCAQPAGRHHGTLSDKGLFRFQSALIRS